ncbi:hypothetical protein H9Q69_013554 [Fusarium xylarioides]|nr:hypothetical protein H9Q69_013554 [Fusarium xylarioides]
MTSASHHLSNFPRVILRFITRNIARAWNFALLTTGVHASSLWDNIAKTIFGCRATRHDVPTQIPAATESVSPELLMIGNTSETWRIGNVVRKLPRTVSDEDITNANLAAARNEANVYLILGEHHLVAKCQAICPVKSYIDLEYYSYGTLRDYVYSKRSNITTRV